jgi:hypothetical protein
MGVREVNVTAYEIAETLLNGNILDARKAILGGATRRTVALMALDVAEELGGTPEAIARLRRCLAAG